MPIPAVVASIVASVAASVAQAAAQDKAKKMQDRQTAKAQMEKAARGEGGGGSAYSGETAMDIKGIVNSAVDGIKQIKAEKEAANKPSVDTSQASAPSTDTSQASAPSVDTSQAVTAPTPTPTPTPTAGG